MKILHMTAYEGLHGFQFGDFTLDMRAHCLLLAGRAIPLTPKEFKTLLILVESAGTAVEKERLIREVWPDTFVADGSLTRNISVLRKHLGQRSIETVPKFGYRFAYPVTEFRQHGVDDPAAGSDIVSTAGHSTGPVVPIWAPRPSREITRQRVFLLVTVCAVILAIAGGVFAAFIYRRSKSISATPVRIAVLPFHRLSKRPDSDYLIDGLSEELTTTLGQMDTDRVRVLASGSSNLYIGTTESPAQISRELGARYLVDGTVQIINQEVEFTVHLIDGRDQAMLWSGKFVRPVSQLPKIQTEMAEVIAREIQIKIAPGIAGHTDSSETSDPQAHQAFLHGRYEMEQQNLPAYRQALEEFTNAADLDPHYARAFAGIAESYINLATAGPPAPAYAYAKAAALNAIRLDDGLAQAHRDLAKVLFCDQNDSQGAEREYIRALQLNPSDARTHHWYAQLLAAERRTNEALREAHNGLALDPLSIGSNSNFALILILAGKPAEAVRHLQTVLSRDPKNELVYAYLGKAYDGLHQYDRAAESFKVAMELSESKDLYEAKLAFALARSGNTAAAKQLVNELEARDRSGEWIPASTMTEAYIGLGEKDRAFYWFQRCVTERSCTLLDANTEPFHSGLSGDPRFEKIAAPLYGHRGEPAQAGARR